MKKLFLTLLIAAAAVPALAQKMPKNSATYDAKIIRVSDGDTIVIAAPFLPPPLKPELAIRVFGVDTPEKGFRAQCPSEAQRGEAASAFTKNAINQAAAQGGKFQVTMYGWDKFGGRVLGDILINGVSLRTELIRNGFAREYYGEAKQSWCQ
jgi:endonuclease YncB( thermonuclease family)